MLTLFIGGAEYDSKDLQSGSEDLAS